MKQFQKVSIDGNTATTHSAYAFSEVASIYPITPSSDMGELADAWSAQGRKNIFGQKLEVREMQSEAGAAGAFHGSLSGGALATTFTASQGLLLMIPNMFKVAGEMQPGVIHCSARAIAAQSLCIFGDHSDVMACRGTGFGMLTSANPQEAQDIAAITHMTAIESSIPFVHFFDGFRTSHTVQKMELIDYDTFAELVDLDAVKKFRAEAMTPDTPYCKVGAQNPDVYFQGRETSNLQYQDLPNVVKSNMAKFAKATGRNYELYEYYGAKDAEKIIIAMGSAIDTIQETIDYMLTKGEKVGVITIRLYRPFAVEDLVAKIPATVKKIAVLDRTKEPGSIGEPLYLDIVASLKGRSDIEIIGGRYGLGSKEFTPSMVQAVYKHLDNNGWHSFTVGINDDVSHLSIPVEEDIDTEDKSTIRCKFWGYGSDGTVSAAKNAIKIIGDGTEKFVQGYFQYDSNKSGGFTVSHLRFGDKPIRSQYLVKNADFISLNRQQYIGRYDILEGIVDGGTFVINCSWKPEDVFKNLTEDMQKTIVAKNIKVYCIDASTIAKKVGLGGKINTVMQTAFFQLSNVLPPKEAIEMTKKFVEKQFLKKGKEVVDMNWAAIDGTVANIFEVPIPAECDKFAKILEIVPADAGDFANFVVDPVLRLQGDNVKVSQMSVNGTLPTQTSRWMKDNRPGKSQSWLSKFDFINPDNHYFDEPYVEYIPSCNGCGETPYVQAVTQLFGDRMLIANATGCSSIYGGSFPNIPYAKDKNGHGPVWGNSLFEDNAEYAYGMRLAIDQNRLLLKDEAEKLAKMNISAELKAALTNQIANFKAVSNVVKESADALKVLLLNEKETAENKYSLGMVINLKDFFVEKSVWAFGGDGWAYDIGYGGLDHVLASDKNINVLVMDTEVYSNTGGQASKSTPRGAVAKFAAGGKTIGKKNLGLMMTTYGHVYVASVNMAADKEQTARAIAEAEAYDGPSIIIAYSACINQGFDLVLAKKQSEKATAAGYWPLYRFNPLNKKSFTWDSPAITEDFDEYVNAEVRYNSLDRINASESVRLRELAKEDNVRRFHDLQLLDKD
ncbi:MAG: pyruvate:ferredoxin (flavodoxin) oxidoreductase [bacterium]